MAEKDKLEQRQSTTPVTSEGSAGSFVKRELHGATFLTLEHVMHMGLVVVVSALVAMGINLALSMWMGTQNSSDMATMDTSMFGAAFAQLEALWAICIVAGLFILVPLLVVLDRRTRSEWLKRPGYTGRVAYKAPLYTALGVLAVAKILAAIAMVSAVITSLVMIGTDVPIAEIYTTQFIPALIAGVVFATASLYLFKLAKGHDKGRTFSLTMLVLGFALSVALLITTVTVVHAQTATPTAPTAPDSYDYNDYMKEYDNGNLEELFNN